MYRCNFLDFTLVTLVLFTFYIFLSFKPLRFVQLEENRNIRKESSLRKLVLEYQYICFPNDWKEIRKYGRKVTILTELGIEFPSDVISTHQTYVLSPSSQISVLSDRYREVQTHLMRSALVFSHWAEKNDVLYTLTCGNLISYSLYDLPMLPWDDDIDFVVQEKHWDKIEELWEQGNNERMLELSGYVERTVIFEDVRVRLYRPKKEKDRFWRVKMRVWGYDDLRGYEGKEWTIDIFRCFAWNRATGLCGLPFKISMGPSPDQSKEDYSLKNLCGVEMRTPSPETAKKWAIRGYGEGILKKRHPSLQRFP